MQTACLVHVEPRLPSARPSDGSSSIQTVWGRSSSARPTASICRSPPDAGASALVARGSLQVSGRNFVDAFNEAASRRGSLWRSGVAPSNEVVPRRFAARTAASHSGDGALRPLAHDGKGALRPDLLAAETRSRRNASRMRPRRFCIQRETVVFARRRWRPKAARPRCPRGPRAKTRRIRADQVAVADFEVLELEQGRGTVMSRGSAHQFRDQACGRRRHLGGVGCRDEPRSPAGLAVTSRGLPRARDARLALPLKLPRPGSPAP